MTGSVQGQGPAGVGGGRDLEPRLMQALRCLMGLEPIAPVFGPSSTGYLLYSELRRESGRLYQLSLSECGPAHSLR